MTADGRVKVLDFGLARVGAAGLDVESDAQTETSPSPGTAAGTVLGTVGYMSPEHVRGQPADARSDIFALGLVLFEMLAGRRAFSRETAAETMTAILREPAPELSLSGSDAPPELGRIAGTLPGEGPRGALPIGERPRLRPAVGPQWPGGRSFARRGRRSRRSPRAPVDCRPSLRQPQPRPGPGVVLRRPDGGDHHRGLEGPGPAGHLPQLGDDAQGRPQDDAGDRSAPRRRPRPRGQRAQGGAEPPHHGPAHRRHDRRPPVGRALRRHAGRRVRHPGEGGARHRRGPAGEAQPGGGPADRRAADRATYGRTSATSARASACGKGRGRPGRAASIRCNRASTSSGSTPFCTRPSRRPISSHWRQTSSRVRWVSMPLAARSTGHDPSMRATPRRRSPGWSGWRAITSGPSVTSRTPSRRIPAARRASCG